jgi:hypothetical protein
MRDTKYIESKLHTGVVPELVKLWIMYKNTGWAIILAIAWLSPHPQGTSGH